MGIKVSALLTADFPSKGKLECVWTCGLTPMTLPSHGRKLHSQASCKWMAESPLVGVREGQGESKEASPISSSTHSIRQSTMSLVCCEGKGEKRGRGVEKSPGLSNTSSS